jgi:GxxExxY protein
MMKTESDPFSYAIIGKAMETHRELGPGLDEHFYHDLLSLRLAEAGITHGSRVRESLVHRGQVADIFEADLLFLPKLVAELKCLRGGFDAEHYMQLLCYLKFWKAPAGLLFDFGKESLAYRRVNYSPARFQPVHVDDLLHSASNLGPDRMLALGLCQAIVRISTEYGNGYRDTTYRGLLAADLNAEQIECATAQVVGVHAANRYLGDTRCDCLNVAGRIGVLVLSLRDNISAADIAILRTQARLLALPHGLILNFAKDRLEHTWLRACPA